MVAGNILRVIVIGFFGMFWAFVIMPGLELVGMRFSAIDRVISYIIVPLVGLLTAQLLLRRLRG